MITNFPVKNHTAAGCTSAFDARQKAEGNGGILGVWNGDKLEVKFTDDWELWSTVEGLGMGRPP